MPDAVCTERDGTVATVILNRPERLNALDLSMAALVVGHLQELVNDEGVLSIIITGSGRAFCSGGDLAWAAAYPSGPANGLHLLASRLHQAVLEIHQTGKPVIAAVNGVAAGAGFSLALACDFRVLDETATFRQAYTSAGLNIDGGGTFILPRLVGLARALEIAAFDEPIDAAHAASAGLATRIAAAGEALDDARALAREFQARSQASFASSKRLLRRSVETPLEVQLEHERAGIVACARSAEGAEGINAFIKKRGPDFPAARAMAQGSGGGARAVIPAPVWPQAWRDATAMDALDASAERVVELVGQVGPEQWNNPTPCPEWNVRTLVGHLIAGMQGYCELLKGAPAATLRSMGEQQSEAAGTDPVTMCKNAVRAVRAAFAEPGALERTVHHATDIPGSQLLAFRIGDNVIHSWDLATAIGVDPGLDDQLVEFVYGLLAPSAESGALYATGWIAAPTRPLPEGATSLERLIHLVGR